MIPLLVTFVNKRSASTGTRNIPVVFVVDIVVSVPTVLSVSVVTGIDSPEVPADALAAGVVVPVVLLVAVGDSVVNVVGVVVLPESTSRCVGLHYIFQGVFPIRRNPIRRKKSYPVSSITF